MSATLCAPPYRINNYLVNSNLENIFARGAALYLVGMICIDASGETLCPNQPLEYCGNVHTLDPVQQ